MIRIRYSLWPIRESHFLSLILFHATLLLFYNFQTVFVAVFIMHLLFVCTGNTCRSPLAEAAWRAFGTPEITASSAGLSATEGLAISPHSAQVAKKWGEDLTKHRARRLSDSLAHKADYLIAMTGDHARILRSRFPHRKVLELGDFLADDNDKNDSVTGELQKLLGASTSDILDPIGGSLEAYQECGEHIKRAVIGLAKALRERRV